MDYALLYSATSSAATAPTGGLDDELLIRAARAGDHNTFNQLVQRHPGHLYTLAYYLVGDAAAVEDALQDALLAAYRSMASYRHGSWVSWLRRIVTHKCYDRLRSGQRRRSLSLVALPENNSQLASPADGPEAVVQRRELARRLEASLAALPFRERQLITLRDIHDLSYVEISATTGYPLGTVKSRLSRARAKLRAELHGKRAERDY